MTREISMQRRLVILAVCFLAAMALQAQVTTATIEGTVTDASGATVPNAQVTAINTGTNQSRSAITNASGAYRFDLLPSGEYNVEVSAQGFKKFRQNGIVLELNRTARVDPVLAIGALTEEVTITADAVMVNTSNAQIGRTTSGSEINNLPIVGRNVYTLLSLTPGVDSNANSIVLGYPEQRTMINGGVDGGAGSVNYFLDGGTNMGMPTREHREGHQDDGGRDGQGNLIPAGTWRSLSLHTFPHSFPVAQK